VIASSTPTQAERDVDAQHDGDISNSNDSNGNKLNSDDDGEGDEDQDDVVEDGDDEDTDSDDDCDVSIQSDVPDSDDDGSSSSGELDTGGPIEDMHINIDGVAVAVAAEEAAVGKWAHLRGVRIVADLSDDDGPMTQVKDLLRTHRYHDDDITQPFQVSMSVTRCVSSVCMTVHRMRCAALVHSGQGGDASRAGVCTPLPPCFSIPRRYISTNSNAWRGLPNKHWFVRTAFWMRADTLRNVQHQRQRVAHSRRCMGRSPHAVVSPNGRCCSKVWAS
jgi:hypothetical protein